MVIIIIIIIIIMATRVTYVLQLRPPVGLFFVLRMIFEHGGRGMILTGKTEELGNKYV
jgi:hypothetical protein